MFGIEDIKRLKGIVKIIMSGAGNFLKIEFDSRKISRGDIFVALRGTRTDGHNFIADAVKNGAVGVCCEVLPDRIPSGVTCIQVKNTAVFLGEMASLYYGEPSSRLALTGITGTNGKTTIATSLYNLFRALGYKTGLFSTTGIYINGKTYETTHTTPDTLTLHRYLAKMVEEECIFAFMEVSSHGAGQDRIAGVSFAGGIFTNITLDHLDYHHDFRSYLYAKKKFFDKLQAGSFALINADDRNARVMVQNTEAMVVTYGIKSPADFHARILESHFNSTLMNIENREVWIPFVGEFNVSNMTAVYVTSVILGQSPETVLEKMSNLPPVPGRFEVLHSPEGIIGIVDYAHTPDAVDNVLKTIRQLRKGGEKVFTVIGAGGNRDRTKRPRMARFAYGLSDILILTSDNPRDENPEDIINDMLEGVTPEGRAKVICIPERGEAIKTAVRMATPGDIILVAGKGHENYQEINGVKHHFDDKEFLTEQFGPYNKQQLKKDC